MLFMKGIPLQKFNIRINYLFKDIDFEIITLFCLFEFKSTDQLTI